MSKAIILDEPQLEFAGGGKTEHPCDGLALFGPADSKGIEKAPLLRYGVIGTKNGITSFREFVKAIHRPVLTEDYLSDTLWPHFPGFEEAFHSLLPVEPEWAEELDALALKDTATERDDHKRVFEVTSFFFEKISAAKKSAEQLNFFVVVVPDFIFMTCRPLSRFPGGHGNRVGKREQRLRAQILDFFESYEPEQYSWSLDFRCQIKARMMDLGVPIQIIRESTLRLGAAERRGGGRQLTPLSDRAWNLSTALYYKSGGTPWKSDTLRDGTCHVGITFKETGTADSVLRSAQMFLDDGDGFIIPGDEGPWSSERKGEYHLNKEGAYRLLSDALKTHKSLGRKKLSDICLHSHSTVNAEEFEGFLAACPKGVKLAAVRVAPERTGLRLFRAGSQPVLRGTFWHISPKRGFLWTSGFKPQLRAYDRFGVPQPLCIDVQHGDTDVLQVAQDIFALTKLNYNACKLGENRPVTIGFSGAVGEILVTNRTAKNHQPHLKYYI